MHIDRSLATESFIDFRGQGAESNITYCKEVCSIKLTYVRAVYIIIHVLVYKSESMLLYSLTTEMPDK